MSPHNTRILKEARTLFWPWCALMAMGVLILLNQVRIGFRPDEVNGLFRAVAFYIGFPLLTAISFGDEFQHRTISALLTQPVSRFQIWREKMSVLLVALISATLLYYAGWNARMERSDTWFVPAIWLLATLGSGAFWTLVARSVLGGLVLNMAVQGLAVILLMAGPLFLGFPLGFESFGFFVAGAAGFACYSAAMFWLGFRQLARFQETGETSGTDLFMGGLKVMPEWRPTGPTLNLFKKEMRLMRPVWLLMLLAAGLAPCVAFLRFVTHADVEFVAVSRAALTIHLVLTVMLIGALSMGEERQFGTHSQNLTLPVSVVRQWLIKLLANTLTAVVGTILVVIAGTLALGSVFLNSIGDVIGYRSIFLVAVFVLLTLPTFWSACAMRGTIRGAVVIFPVSIALTLAGLLGSLFNETKWMESAIDWTILNAHPFLPSLAMLALADDVRKNGAIGIVMPIIPLLAVIPFVALALVQSYRLFRTEEQQTVGAVLRYLIPLCVFAFVCSLYTAVFMNFTGRIGYHSTLVFRETVEAIEKLHLDSSKLDAAHPQPVSVEELGNVYALSGMSRAWLANADISVAPKPDTRLLKTRNQGVWREPDSLYSASIRFREGWDCRLYASFFTCKAPDGSRRGFPAAF